MRFLADENFPGPSYIKLASQEIDIKWVAKIAPGIDDQKVMNLAMEEQRTILTHDSDYGELIFKHGYKPANGVVYFRLNEFTPEEPAEILLELIGRNYFFEKRLTVVDANSVRERMY